ncbi:Ig-like domain-containing protein [Paenibacillus sp. TRM 82003]|nr:Ig-like domain-containing protein [Paenibacillus sp. TRM 82003]
MGKRIRLRHEMKRVVATLLTAAMVCAGWTVAAAAPIDSIEYNALTGTDFENGDPWGFTPGGGATASVVEEEDGNSYLAASGSGSGTRAVMKTLETPTDRAQVLFAFDWKPGEVSTAANSSEISFRDVNDAPIFRIVKAGGPNGELRYGVGSAGTDLSATASVTGITYTESWLDVKVLFDFESEAVTLEIAEKADPTKSFSAEGIDFGGMNYVNKLAKVAVVGNRAGGQTLNFTTGLDNFQLYGSDAAAPAQGVQNVASIATAYSAQLTVPQGVAKSEVIANFPSAVSVLLENGASVDGVPIAWDSAAYDESTLGAYTFVGTLNVEGVPNVANGNGVAGTAVVTVVDASAIPPVDGFEGVYYSDFGDTVAPVPVNWGFTTANATVSIDAAEVAGNATPKLKYSIVNQSGGRVATKTFDAAVKGNKVLVKFDWQPGKNNDKAPHHASENGGELRLFDATNANAILTFNNTNQAPLTVFAGTQAPTTTGFTDPLRWIAVEALFDVVENEVLLTLTDKASGASEQHTLSLDGVAFDGSVASVKLVGLRTSGNNHTWTTYLDNFGVYHVPTAGNTVTTVDRLPYHRVYVGTTTEDIASIGLPSSVTVSLVNGDKANVAVSEWIPVGDHAWDPTVSGVYTFSGTLATDDAVVNPFGRTATIYVENRLSPPVDSARQTEWLDRGLVALTSEDGVFVSWRLLASEYDRDVKFHLFRNDKKLTKKPLTVTNYADPNGKPGDKYRIMAWIDGKPADKTTTTALANDYLSIPLQKPAGGETATGAYEYVANDAGVGDLDGDGAYEVIVKWYPTNAIDSSQTGMTGPTIFDAYKLDGTLLWRMNMGLNLTSGAHYNQFIVMDFDGDGKSEFLIKTADATTVYGATDGVVDESKVVSVIGNAADNGKWVNETGHVYGGPEYITVFDGETGEAIDTVDYVYALGDVASWGDTWWNRSDRFLSGVAYLDGVKPSAIYGRGYYERTTFAAYSLVDGELVTEWTFDSAEEGRGGGLGYHSLATGDVDNDGFDEIIAGSLTLDQDGTILYAMDGKMGREQGSHGDALHVGAFDPDREGLQVMGVHEVPAVASIELHDGGTGETLMSYYGNVDAGRGLAANIHSAPGYEFWGTAGPTAESGGGIYNVQGGILADSFRSAGLAVNFALYWDGDLQHELLDQTFISQYNEATGASELVRSFEGVTSNNGTKATPSLQADILGDWREEVLLPTTDSTELRVFSTTTPTEYRLYTLMHDTVYRMGVAWQNSAYNQPPHISFYLGEDVRDEVLAGALEAPKTAYTNEPKRPGRGNGKPGRDDDDKPGRGDDKPGRGDNKPGRGDDDKPGRGDDKSDRGNGKRDRDRDED